uniref:Sorting nexin-1 n=1 Tax=Electrophorus electricus TaxID=8005 RepID=A0A4W4EQN0_ELEEL
MSVSSLRNPPPFLDGEDQEPEYDTRDLDSDDGEDIFTGRSNKPFTPTPPETDPPTDIFSEEGYTVQTPIKHPSLHTNILEPKFNGIQSDEELDLFAEATVELTLTTPNSQGRKEVCPTGPHFSILNAHSSLRMPDTSNKTMEELEEEEHGDTFELNIAVTNPEKMGDGMNAFMTYKVSTQTSLPAFRSKTFSVRRRFSDFLGLYEKLLVKQSLMGCIIPPPPQKSVVGMTKVKVGKEDPSSADFVEKRRAALERYLQRVVVHPALLQDPDVQEFLEKEEWFESKLQEVENEEQLLRRLHASFDSLVNHRKELCSSTAMFAKSVAMLGSSEENSALSRALSQLAEVEDKLEQLQQEQAFSDFFIFTELLADYVRLLGAVRGCFEQRVKAWQRWQEAQSTLQKKREAEAKLLWANKPDKLQQAKDDITEWEAKVGQSERDFERISSTLRKEVHRFEKEKCRDFRHHIVKYLESLHRTQHRLVKCWETFLPEAKAIV